MSAQFLHLCFTEILWYNFTFLNILVKPRYQDWFLHFIMCANVNSYCSIPETNIILQINCISINKDCLLKKLEIISSFLYPNVCKIAI